MNRVVVIIACLCWLAILGNHVHNEAPPSEDLDGPKLDARPLAFTQLKDVIFLFLIALGIIERLSRFANVVSIERDWVPTLANNGIDDKQSVRYDLTHLNAVMARIDLVCRLGSPIAISIFMALTKFSRLGALGLIVINLITWPLEYWTARTVWDRVDRLRQSNPATSACIKEISAVESSRSNDETHTRISFKSCWRALLDATEALSLWFVQYGSGLRQYFTTDVWKPSLAMTGLHFSVLTFSSTLIVFLVQSGFSMRIITCAEVVSATFELSSTYLFPWGVRFLSTQDTEYLPLKDVDDGIETNLASDETTDLGESSLEKRQEEGVSRLGLIALVLMLICLVWAKPDLCMRYTDLF